MVVPTRRLGNAMRVCLARKAPIRVGSHARVRFAIRPVAGGWPPLDRRVDNSQPVRFREAGNQCAMLPSIVVRIVAVGGAAVAVGVGVGNGTFVVLHRPARRSISGCNAANDGRLTILIVAQINDCRCAYVSVSGYSLKQHPATFFIGR